MQSPSDKVNLDEIFGKSRKPGASPSFFGDLSSPNSASPVFSPVSTKSRNAGQDSRSRVSQSVSSHSRNDENQSPVGEMMTKHSNRDHEDCYDSPVCGKSESPCEKSESPCEKSESPCEKSESSSSCSSSESSCSSNYSRKKCKKNKNSKTWLWILIAGGFFVLVILAGVYYKRRSCGKSNTAVMAVSVIIALLILGLLIWSYFA
jgi:hypothetical protein